MSDKSDELFHQHLSPSARRGLLYILEEYSKYLNDTKLIKDLSKAKRIIKEHRDLILSQEKEIRIRYIAGLISESKWWEVLDLCEIMSLSFYKKRLNKRGEFSKSLNRFFKGEGIGYKMQEGRIEKLKEKDTSRDFQKARKPSKDASLSETNKLWQWMDAHKVYSILGALAAIATVIGVVFAILNYVRG